MDWDSIFGMDALTLLTRYPLIPLPPCQSDGWTLLSGGRDGVVVAWNLRTNEKMATIPVFEALEGA
jgi:hypothetical protein